jgi:hypothetical protein
MKIDDREEGRLSTVEVSVGDTGKRGRVRGSLVALTTTVVS